MSEEVKAEFPIGKTQWAKWGPKAREAFNKCMRLGFKFDTAVGEANAVQAKVRSAALDELAQLGQEMDAEGAAQPVELVAPPPEENVAQVSAASPSPTASTPKKPRAPRKKKA